MEEQNLNTGVELSIDFAGHPVYFIKHEGSYYVECKKALFLYDDYLSYLKDPNKDIIGHNLEGKPCKIRHFNGLTTIGCLKDSTEKFNSIIKHVKILKNEDSRT